MSLLKCDKLTLGYEDITLVQDLSFEVNPGEYWCVAGENGTGKTTLMKTILGLKKPLKGTITHGDGLKKNEIGYLPQQTIIQKDFPASVYEVVLSGFQGSLGFLPFYSKEAKRVAELNMDRLGIKDISSKCYRDLSGGQQQRVLLARALCATKKMLLLDEPVAGLDPKVTEEMYDLIYKLNREDGIAIFMISHDMNSIDKYATHVMHFGTLSEDVTISKKGDK